MNLRLTDAPRCATGEPVRGAVAFRTCLRDILFWHERPSGIHSTTVLEDAAAYTRLLEVVCGLRSPMPGETQVQGQFKRFLDSLDVVSHSFLRHVGQLVLADAKAIRAAHLQGLGSRSYGSAVRREVRGIPHVAIIGTGSLGREILDYVVRDHTVDVWTRRTLSSASPSDGQPRVGDVATAIVVAAPVTSDTIIRVASRYTDVRRLVDLRADDERTPIAAPVVVTLQDLFLRAGPGVADARLDAARDAARLCGIRYEARDVIRPFGWEDLCASGF